MMFLIWEKFLSSVVYRVLNQNIYEFVNLLKLNQL